MGTMQPEPEYEGPTYDPECSGGEFHREHPSGAKPYIPCRWDSATHVCVADGGGATYYAPLADYFDEGDLIWMEDGDRWAFGPKRGGERPDWIFDGQRVHKVTDEAWEEIQAQEARESESKPRTPQQDFFDALLKGKLGAARPRGGLIFPRSFAAAFTVSRSEYTKAGSKQKFFELIMHRLENRVLDIAARVLTEGFGLADGEWVIERTDLAPTGVQGEAVAVRWNPRSRRCVEPYSESTMQRIRDQAPLVIKDLLENKIAKYVTEMVNGGVKA